MKELDSFSALFSRKQTLRRLQCLHFCIRADHFHRKSSQFYSTLPTLHGLRLRILQDSMLTHPQTSDALLLCQPAKNPILTYPGSATRSDATTLAYSPARSGEQSYDHPDQGSDSHRVQTSLHICARLSFHRSPYRRIESQVSGPSIPMLFASMPVRRKPSFFIPRVAMWKLTLISSCVIVIRKGCPA